VILPRPRISPSVVRGDLMKTIHTATVFVSFLALSFFGQVRSTHAQVLSELSLPPNGANERAEVSQWIGLVKITIDYHSPPFDANIWITCCSGRVQISRINCWISGPTSTTIAPITHGKGERRICQCHHPSPICARFAGNHTVEAYIRHPWPLEFLKICASCDMQVSVGKHSE
jgi:hypothetical protein